MAISESRTPDGCSDPRVFQAFSVLENGNGRADGARACLFPNSVRNFDPEELSIRYARLY